MQVRDIASKYQHRCDKTKVLPSSFWNKARADAAASDKARLVVGHSCMILLCICFIIFILLYYFNFLLIFFILIYTSICDVYIHVFMIELKTRRSKPARQVMLHKLIYTIITNQSDKAMVVEKRG